MVLWLAEHFGLRAPFTDAPFAGTEYREDRWNLAGRDSGGVERTSQGSSIERVYLPERRIVYGERKIVNYGRTIDSNNGR